jgi:hypothetical protein
VDLADRVLNALHVLLFVIAGVVVTYALLRFPLFMRANYLNFVRQQRLLIELLSEERDKFERRCDELLVEKIAAARTIAELEGELKRRGEH